jgi:hypothetical protein
MTSEVIVALFLLNKMLFSIDNDSGRAMMYSTFNGLEVLTCLDKFVELWFHWFSVGEGSLEEALH